MDLPRKMGCVIEMMQIPKIEKADVSNGSSTNQVTCGNHNIEILVTEKSFASTVHTYRYVHYCHTLPFSTVLYMPVK